MIEVPDAVRELLRERVDSVEALETLLLLRRYPERRWEGQAVAEQLRLPGAPLGEILMTLARHELLEVAEAPPRFRYGPKTPQLAQAVDELQRIYESDRTGILHVMTENAIDRVRHGLTKAFADAFVLRRGTPKDDPDA
jgi:hypothetical protein